jgi:hypothetical protein
MRLNLDTVRNMTRYECVDLALQAFEEGDRTSFWLLCGFVTAKIDSGSEEANALWKAGHETEGNIPAAVAILRQLQKGCQ